MMDLLTLMVIFTWGSAKQNTKDVIVRTQQMAGKDSIYVRDGIVTVFQLNGKSRKVIEKR